jgi:HAE1 family hydrophobic/amphiphilic exporter-1
MEHAYLLQRPEVATVFSNVGGAAPASAAWAWVRANKAELTVQLKPKDERGNVRTEAYMKALREDLLQGVPGVSIGMAPLGLIPRAAPP